MAEPEPVGDAWLVAPGDQARYAVKLTVERRGDGPIALYAGEAARKHELERDDRRIATLETQLGRVEEGSDGGPGVRRRAAAGARRAARPSAHELATSAAPPPPATGNWFAYELVPVRHVIRARSRRSPTSCARLAQTIGRVNVAAARGAGAAGGGAGRARPTSAWPRAASATSRRSRSGRRRCTRGVEDARRRRQAVPLRLHRLPRDRLAEAGRRQPRHRREARRSSTCSARPATGRASKHVDEAGLDEPPYAGASGRPIASAPTTATPRSTPTRSSWCPTCATSSARVTAKRRAPRSATA